MGSPPVFAGGAHCTRTCPAPTRVTLTFAGGPGGAFATPIGALKGP